MSVKIEISDLGGTSKGDLIKVAKFMLEFAGYSDTQPAKVPTPPAPEPAAHVWPEDEPASVEVATLIPPTLSEPGGLGTYKVPGYVAPPPPPGIEVDAMGMPWDARIHSGSRARVADGSWRQKRNLDPNVLAQVESELRQTMGLPAPASGATSSVTTVPSLPIAPPVAPIQPAAVVSPESAFAAAVAPVAVPVPPPFVPNVVTSVAPPTTTPAIVSAGAVTTASPSSATVTFPALMQKITQAFAAKQLDQATIQSACQQVGLPSLPMLASRPDLVGQVANILGLAL